MIDRIALAVAVVFASSPFNILAQSSSDLNAIKGLAPVTVLTRSVAGRAALGANYTVTQGIQTGAIRQPLLLPFAEQQHQALRDAFIADGNLADLADGLGTTLGSAYVARAHYIDRQHFTKSSPAISDVILFATSVSACNANIAKYFFANGTTDGASPASLEALLALKVGDGDQDVFGKAYGHPAGTPGADRYGNSRPFQTESGLGRLVGPDYFNDPTDNEVYNRGPIVDLGNSPSYPSGHTTYGYTGALILALLVPERYQQMITRGAEYGNDRILMGAHYAMDVIGGRTLALFDMAHLLANDPAYVGYPLKGGKPIGDFRGALAAARAELASQLRGACNNTLDACAREDIGRFSNSVNNEAFYDVTQTYGLPVVYPKNSGVVEDVGKMAPEAGFLLTAAIPTITLEQANKILTETEGPGGGFLDDGSPFGVYSRLNLYAAFGRAAQLAWGK